MISNTKTDSIRVQIKQSRTIPSTRKISLSVNVLKARISMTISSKPSTLRTIRSSSSTMNLKRLIMFQVNLGRNLSINRMCKIIFMSLKKFGNDFNI